MEEIAKINLCDNETMAYLLRSLLILMISGLALTTLMAHQMITLPLSHIEVSIPAFIFAIFAQAFVMFYFIGVARLVDNVHRILQSGENLKELFDKAPEDLTPYQKKVNQFHYESKLCKRQTIPWTILMLVLGMIAFLLGGAHDTQLVSKATHSGVVYGFLVAAMIGFFRQWVYLGKTHLLLRKLKTLFQIPDGQM
jgi:ABC-type multidrug transport system fused ATPase/permease subunit